MPLLWGGGGGQSSCRRGSVTEDLQKLYREKLQPLEKHHDFHRFHPGLPELNDAHFASRPKVLLLGQFSTGKTTLIRHLLGEEYSELRVGPEPVTDNFTVIVHGEAGQTQPQVVPGHSVVLDGALPFTRLSSLGHGFLSRLELMRLPSPMLRSVTLIDSPGVDGQRQQIADFEEAVSWFADTVDMVILVFDATKLDISEALGQTIAALRGNEQKVHIVLNKADCMPARDLHRVTCAFMMKLGRVLDSERAPQIYTGSFWRNPYKHNLLRRLFESEEADLYQKIAQLSRLADTRRLEDLIRRARLVKVHAHLLATLRGKLPTLWRGPTKEELIENLGDIYTELVRDKDLCMGDFPDVEAMKEALSGADVDFVKFQKIDSKMKCLETLLSEHAPSIQARIGEDAKSASDVEIAPVRRAGRLNDPCTRSIVRAASRSRSRSPRSLGSSTPVAERTPGRTPLRRRISLGFVRGSPWAGCPGRASQIPFGSPEVKAVPKLLAIGSGGS